MARRAHRRSVSHRDSEAFSWISPDIKQGSVIHPYCDRPMSPPRGQPNRDVNPPAWRLAFAFASGCESLRIAPSAVGTKDVL
jgi:hypothetical protein